MKKMYSVVALLLALVMAMSAVSFAAAETEAKVYAVGDTMDDFTITLTDGTSVTLSDLLATHKAVLINIWATWCSPCRSEFPYMEEAYSQVQDDLAIVAVSCEPSDTDDVINEFKEENGLSILPMAADTIGLTEWFEYDGIPTSIMVDRNGVICWQESGSITSVDTFMRLFTPFIADDYSESLVGFEIPKVAPNVEAPAVEDAAKVLLADGSDLTVSFDTEDEYAWPWLVDDGCLVASNTGIDDSYATVSVSLTAADGDVLSYDAKVSCETMYDYMYVSLDGKMVKVLDGEKDWSTYALALTAGEHIVSFTYQKDAASSEAEDTAWVKNVKVLSGDEAAALVASMPAFPYALESGVSVVLDDAAAKEIVFEYADPGYAETFSDALGKMYVVNSDTATVKVSIGSDIDPEMAAVYNNFDGSLVKLAEADIEGDAFVVSGGVSAMDIDGYSYSTFYTYYDMYDAESDILAVTLFHSEENVNTFISEMNAAYQMEVFSSWCYADGTQPSTDALAEASADVQTGVAAYQLTFVDQDGNAVAGVMANVCDDDTCTLMTADENGVIEFTGVPFAYHIQVIKVPEGYEFDTSAEYYTKEEGGELVFELTKTAN